MFSHSVRAFLPKNVTIPFRQAAEDEYFCGFKEGDSVKEGQVIASPKIDFDGANIHSSVPGKIVSISQCTLPDGTLGKAAVISTEGSFSYLGKKNQVSSWDFLSSSSLLEEFKVKGIVNTFGRKSFPLSSQIRKCKKENGKFVVVRMFDEDPSRFTDSFLSEKFFKEVVEGSLIVAKAFDARGIIFVFPNTFPFEIDEKDMKGSRFFSLKVDSSKYPVGLMSTLIEQIHLYAKESGETFLQEVDKNCIFLDPSTSLSVFDAIVYGIPLVERYVHVFGSCLKSAGIFKVRVGSSIKSLVEQCGGFTKSPEKIIINGMIRGTSVGSLDVPVTKSVKSISFSSSSFSSFISQGELLCVRCGKCRKVCPSSLQPDLLYRHSIEGYPLQKEILETSIKCFQCNLCSSFCPSRLPLSTSISLL